MGSEEQKRIWVRGPALRIGGGGVGSLKFLKNLGPEGQVLGGCPSPPGDFLMEQPLVN